MSEPVVTETAETAAEPETPQEGLPDSVRDLLAKKNSEAANLRKRLKELEPLAREAEAAREAQKSELQRLQEQHEVALAELTEANRAVIRERVARKLGLPDELAEVLRGDDEAEMTTHAERLAAHLAPHKERRPDPSQGAAADTALNGDPLLRDLKHKLGIA